MKKLLEETIKFLISGNLTEAKNSFSKYIHIKSVNILNEEKLEKGLIKGECKNCGESVIINNRIHASGKWSCPKCDSKNFEKSDNQEIKD